MQVTDRRFRQTADLDPLERELREVAQVVEQARRNPWYGGDVLEPEFRPVLSAIVAPRPRHHGQALRHAPDWRPRRNRWAYALEQVG